MNEVYGGDDLREEDSAKDLMQKVEKEFDEVFTALFDAGEINGSNDLSQICLKRDENGDSCGITLTIGENNYRSMAFYLHEHGGNPGVHFTLEVRGGEYNYRFKKSKIVPNAQSRDPHWEVFKEDVEKDAKPENVLEKYLPKFRSLLDAVKEQKKRSKGYTSKTKALIAQILNESGSI